MNDYYYAVSLRITHPKIDPTIITTELGINPFRAYIFGDQRITPKGSLLESVNRKSFWAARLHDSKNILDSDIHIEVFIAEWTEKLSRNQVFFQQIIDNGGTVEFFIGLFGNENFGFSFPSLLMKKLSDLNINIGFNIYPD